MPDLAARPFNIADEFIHRPARENPRKIAILRPAGAVTYADLESQVNRVAQALRNSHCEPGDRVLIALPDSLEFVAAFFGAVKMGALAAPVNPMARSQDYRHYLENSDARLAIVDAPILGEFAAAAAANSLDLVVICNRTSGTERPGRIARQILAWDDWLPTLAQAPAQAPPQVSDVPTHPTSSTDPAFFLYTSGSGGTPKAAVHRQQDMLVATKNFAAGVLGIRSDDRLFSVSKLYFAYGLGNGMYFPLYFGATTILHPDRPRPDEIAELIALHRPTIFFSVPTFYAALLQELERGLNLDLSSVRLAVSAGESLPSEIFLKFRQRFGLEILDGIGSTEMLHIFLSSRPGQARPGSCGREVPGYQARILGDSGEPLPDGEAGNLWTKGDSAFAEYWRIPELTARTKRDGWVNTGDKFTRDADGFYHYCGRADDMMKVSGMWVSPGEVENALLAHSAIAECAVVAHADAVGLIRPVAYIVLRHSVINAAGGLDSEINGWLRTRLPGFKCPQEFRFVTELPKTSTGKIQRYLLRSR
ncbi:MAG: benzoate-CoA ligase family protein [Candidatus Acidiferrales bacterium]